MERNLLAADLTGRILGCAYEVHNTLGPGLMESAYRQCLLEELKTAQLAFRAETPIPLIYKGVELNCSYRADVVVEESVLVELKAVERLLPIHSAQLLTYLKLTGLRVGLLMNFTVGSFRNGFRRLVL
jgi:GxxExxY protein